jgi:hypothetical protein
MRNVLLHEIALPPGRVGCSEYVDHLSSYDTLITRLLGDELSASNALRGADHDYLRKLCREILWPMDTRVLHCILRGDLPRQYRTDPVIRKILKKLWNSQTP